jgi:hypothetical protein
MATKAIYHPGEKDQGNDGALPSNYRSWDAWCDQAIEGCAGGRLVITTERFVGGGDDVSQLEPIAGKVVAGLNGVGAVRFGGEGQTDASGRSRPRTFEGALLVDGVTP